MSCRLASAHDTSAVLGPSSHALGGQDKLFRAVPTRAPLHVNKLTLNPLHYSVTRVDGLRDEVERDFRLTLMQFGHGTPGQAASSLQPATQLGARITSLIPSETKSCSFLHMKIDAPVTSMIVPVLVPQLV